MKCTYRLDTFEYPNDVKDSLHRVQSRHIFGVNIVPVLPKSSQLIVTPSMFLSALKGIDRPTNMSVVIILYFFVRVWP